MNKLTKLFLACALSLSFFSVFSFTSVNLVSACSCAAPTVEKALSVSEAVFLGKAVSVKTEANVDDPVEPLIEVTFDVQTWWKGGNSSQMVINTVHNAYTCNGYVFHEGSEYLIYAFKNSDGTLGTSFCSRTSEVSQVEPIEFAQLGAGIPPQQGASYLFGPIALLSAATIGLILVVTIWRVHKQKPS